VDATVKLNFSVFHYFCYAGNLEFHIQCSVIHLVGEVGLGMVVEVMKTLRGLGAW
jgi:hypothetical protein